MTGAWRGSQETSSQEPARSRSDLASWTSSAETPPASITSAAKLRENPISFARAVSVRSPARPSGSGRLRFSTVLLRFRYGVRFTRPFAGAVEPYTAHRQDDEQPHAGDDEDVCHVEDGGESPDLDEVDHVAEPETRLPEQPVEQVAECAAQQHPEHDRPGERFDAEIGRASCRERVEWR